MNLMSKVQDARTELYEMPPLLLLPVPHNKKKKKKKAYFIVCQLLHRPRLGIDDKKLTQLLQERHQLHRKRASSACETLVQVKCLNWAEFHQITEWLRWEGTRGYHWA